MRKGVERKVKEEELLEGTLRGSAGKKDVLKEAEEKGRQKGSAEGGM